MKTNNRGGSGRGQGRKSVAEGQATVTVSLRMTEAQRDKLKRLGGAKWVRQRIDKAKSPNVEAEGAARLCAQLPSSDGLGVAVPPAPTFEGTEK